MNWKGINIDANYIQMQCFHSLRLDDLNLNYAVSNEPNSFVEMHINMARPSVSSLRNKLVNNQTKETTKETIMNVPSVKSSDICERYYIKRPAMMNIDV